MQMEAGRDEESQKANGWQISEAIFSFLNSLEGNWLFKAIVVIYYVSYNI